MSRYETTTLTDADADRILAEANAVLEEENGPGDVKCKIGLRRSGAVSTFSTGSGEIASKAAFDEIIALPGQIKVVNAIRWCKDPGSGIIGCSPIGGDSMVVIRHDQAGRQEGILWAHEYGHDCGLDHRNDDENEVMCWYVDPSHTFVNDAEKDAYQSNGPSASAHGPQATLAAMREGKTTAAATTAAAGDVEALVRKRYVHGLPYEEASAFGPAVVPELIKMLNDPEEAKWRSNIVKMLGIIGDPRAVDPMIKLVEEGQGTLSPMDYDARHGAVIFLGDVIHKTQNPQNPAVIKAFAYLRDGTVNPAVWSQRVHWSSPFTKNASQRNWQLTKSAVWGLAMTGMPEAGDAIKALQDNLPNMEDVPSDVSDVVKEAKAALSLVRGRGLKTYRTQHKE